MSEPTKTKIAVISFIAVLIGIFVFIVLSVRDAKGHCIPNNGVFNNVKVWVASEMGLQGINCQ